MNEAVIIGYFIMAAATFVGLLVGIQNLTKPLKEEIKRNTESLNNSRIEMQRFNDSIFSMEESNKTRDARIEQHGKEIDQLDKRMGKLETKVSMYHEENH